MKKLRNIKNAASLAAIALGFGLFGCSAPDTVGHKSISLLTSVSLNPGNPYDSVGQEHDAILRYALSLMDSTGPEGTDTLAYRESIASAMGSYAESRYGITTGAFDSMETQALNTINLPKVRLPNFFDTLSTNTGLTLHEVSYMNRMGSAYAFVAANNGNYMDSILAIESDVISDTWAPGENHVQMSISVAKWSCDFWTNEVSSTWLSRLGGLSSPGGGPRLCQSWLENDEEGCEIGSWFGPFVSILLGVLFSLLTPDDAY